ncbi:MAG: nuclear transport factor 2 family protein [Candidatus Thorarchaeota archaeon]
MHSKGSILKLAKDFDDAIETSQVKRIIPYFHEECTIELLGLTLEGHEGVQKWLKWMFEHLSSIRFEPVVVMVEGNVFFEEFIVHGLLNDGEKVQSKQAEVLVFENSLVKSLRLYFDRLDFADAVTSGWLTRKIIKKLITESVKGLV